MRIWQCAMDVFQQYVIGLVVNLSTIAAGMILGFSAVALPPMQQDEHRPRVSHLQASWIASIASIAIPVGCLTIGGLLDRMGRRRAMILLSIPAILGWMLIATTSQHEDWFFYQVLCAFYWYKNPGPPDLTYFLMDKICTIE